ncbi:MAG TPA: HAMP domain-containing sensor histidine kinase [Virgibacillus sp.]|nr:HAMP domain-containing sensor histidine kinase [Virgibacillus sp.]
MKHWKWKALSLLTVIIIVMGICWSIAYWGLNGLYHYLQWAPGAFMSQLLTSIIGILFFFGLFYLLVRAQKRQRNQHMEYIQTIIDAIKQIAQGNFNIYLPKRDHPHPDDPFNQIVDNINDMTSKLGEMEELRQQFVSNVSHEIQSPLTSISGFAAELKNESLSVDDRNYYLEIIETESKRLSNISDNLLRLTYLESANHNLKTEAFRLDTQIKHAVLATEPQWTVKRITVLPNLDKVSIIADKALLNQVWINLLNNAIKFTPENGHIHLDLSKEAEYALISISDNGVGIAESDQLHLYERFYKVDKSRTNRSSGSGLGLSIVKRILDLHHASIHVDTAPGEGTTFHMTIPLALGK